MYRIYKKILNSDEGNFKIFGEKWYVLEEILQLPEHEGGITCMIMSRERIDAEIISRPFSKKVKWPGWCWNLWSLD